MRIFRSKETGKAEAGDSHEVIEQCQPRDEGEPGAEIAAEDSEMEQESAPDTDVAGEAEELDAVVTGATIDSRQLTRAQAESRENFDKYIRALAELENVKKRAAKDRSDLLKYGNENIARDLLEVVDNFERALSQANYGSVEELLTGVKLIYDRLVSILNNYSVKGESAVGAVFDPSKHEALATISREGAAPNTVVEELKKAYFYKDKLLRAAQVVVSAQPASAVAPGSGENTDAESESSGS
jgi:molecular chaperone GrpE